MQIPNNRVFNLNSAVTPEIQWGTISPSDNNNNPTLTAMPVGSMYIQQLGGSPVTSCIVWVKTISDLVAAQNYVSPWTAVSQTPVSTGSTAPDFASDELMLYQPGMIYVHNETKNTGTYRTAWLKVVDGGTRSDWLSIAESESLERMFVTITANPSYDIAENSALTWRFPTSGTPTVVEESPTNSGAVGSGMTLTVPTGGLYSINMIATISPSIDAVGVIGLALNGAISIPLQSTRMIALSTAYISGSCVTRLSKDNIIGLAVAIVASSGTHILTDVRISMALIAP